MADSTLDRAPRGVVYRMKSGTPDVTDNYQRKLRNFRDGAREQAVKERRQNKEFSKIQLYIRNLLGDMWPENRPRFRSRFVDNHLNRARRETLAQYTDVRPTISVHSEPFPKHADILQKMMVHEWVRGDMDLKLAEVLDHAMLAEGYWKVNASLGRLSVLSLGMDQVMTINCPSDIQDSSAVRYSTFKPIQYFVDKWGRDVAERVLKSGSSAYRSNESNTPPNQMMSEYSWSKLSPSMKHMLKDRAPGQYGTWKSEDAFPVGELEELWVEDGQVNESLNDVLVKDPRYSIERHNYWYVVKPGQRLYPRKRLLVFGGDESLYDTTSPYWTTLYPFVKFVLDPVVWAPGGLSKYRTLLPINLGVNEISAGVFDTIKKAINQAYVAKRGSVSEADWNRFYPEIPGQKMLMNATADIRDVRPLDPPNLPSYVFEYSKYLLSMFDRHAGSMDTASLSKKKQVPGGDTMEQIRDAQGGPIRLEGRYIEVALRNAGEIGVSHVIQYFPKKQRYWIMGNDGVTWDDYTWDPENMVPADHARDTFWKNFSVMIAQGSLHGANKDRDAIKALNLFRAGALSMETLLKKCDIPDVAAEIARIVEERKAGILGQQAAGRTPRMSRGQRNGQIA
jgi:hypothetical protein